MKPLNHLKTMRFIILFLPAFSLYHVYLGYYPAPGAMSLSITHVCLALTLCYLLSPAKKILEIMLECFWMLPSE